jgi:hypothetical protein
MSDGQFLSLYHFTGFLSSDPVHRGSLNSQRRHDVGAVSLSWNRASCRPIRPFSALTEARFLAKYWRFQKLKSFFFCNLFSLSVSAHHAKDLRVYRPLVGNSKGVLENMMSKSESSIAIRSCCPPECTSTTSVCRYNGSSRTADVWPRDDCSQVGRAPTYAKFWPQKKRTTVPHCEHSISVQNAL